MPSKSERGQPCSIGRWNEYTELTTTAALGEALQQLLFVVLSKLVRGLFDTLRLGQLGQGLEGVDVPRRDRHAGEDELVIDGEGGVGLVEWNEALVGEEDLPADGEKESASSTCGTDTLLTIASNRRGHLPAAHRRVSWASNHPREQ